MIDKIKDILSSINLRDFHTRQKVLIILLIVAGIFLLFYGSHLIIQGQIAKTRNYIETSRDRVAQVQQYIAKVQEQSSRQQLLTTGLLSHIQGIKQRYNLGGDIVNIRLVSSANRQEQVTFRAENLVYQEFSTILNDLEQYDNIWVRSVGVTKRFDNPMRIDVSFDVIRSEQ